MLPRAAPTQFLYTMLAHNVPTQTLPQCFPTMRSRNASARRFHRVQARYFQACCHTMPPHNASRRWRDTTLPKGAATQWRHTMLAHNAATYGAPTMLARNAAALSIRTELQAMTPRHDFGNCCHTTAQPDASITNANIVPPRGAQAELQRDASAPCVCAREDARGAPAHKHT